MIYRAHSTPGKHRLRANRLGSAGGYAGYIGRVGALAVALGVGSAVGLPGVAWATPDASSAPSDNAGPTSTPSDTTGAPQTTSEPSADPSPSTNPADAAAPTPATGTSQAETVSEGSSPTVTISGSGGANTTINGSESTETEPVGEATTPTAEPPSSPETPAAQPRPEAPLPKGGDSAAPPAETAVQSQSVPTTTVGVRIAPSEATLSLDSGSEANSVAPQMFSAFTSEPVADATVAEPASAPVTTPTETNLATQVVTNILTPLLGSSPNAPLSPALAWAVLAFARREVTSGPEAQMAMLTSTAAPGPNKAPTAAPTITGVDLETGVVTGNLNAGDPNGDPLTFSPSKPKKGTVVIASDGTFTYTPTDAARHAASATSAEDFDAFSVTIRDGRGGIKTTFVRNVPVTPTNDAPVNGDFSVTSVTPSTGTVKGIVTADDPDDDKLTYKGTTTTAKGRVIVSSTGGFTYTPTAAARHAAVLGGDAATDTFTVTVTDGHGGTLAVPVSVTITPANHAPVYGKATVGKPDPITGVVTGTVKAIDADKDTLTYSGPTSTTKGSVVVQTNGSFTYTPTQEARQAAAAGGAAAKDSFTVVVSDGYGGTQNVTVNVAVSPNRAPINGIASVGDANPNSGIISGFVRATDPDRDPVTYSGTADTDKGSVVVASNGSFTYTPDPEARAAAHGSTMPVLDSFTITASDGRGGTLGIPVSVVVTPSNSAPEAVADPTVGTPNSEGVITGSLNVSDPEGDALTYTVVNGPANGTVTFDATAGTYSYKPTDAARLQATLTNDVVETDSFTVAVTDGASAPVVVNVDNILVTELPANSVIATPEVGDGPTAVVISSDGTRAYVANTDGDTITVLDGVDGTMVRTIEVGDQPVALALNSTGSVLYVGTAGDNSVVAIDTTTWAVGDPVVVPGAPTGIAVSAGDDKVFVTDASDTLTMIDVATGETTSFNVDPLGLALSPDNRYLYLANSAEQALTIFDLQNPAGSHPNIGVGGTPSGVVVIGDKVYVTVTDTDKVAIIDRANNNAITFVDVGDQPRGIDVTDDGRVYVANFGSDNVAIIDTANNNAVSFVDVGDGPYDVEINPVTNTVTITTQFEDRVTVLLLDGNEPPVLNPVVNAPDAAGVVTGTLGVTDRDNDTLAYEVASGGQGTNGTVVIDPATGAFTYTPTPEAQHAAAFTPGDDTDTITLVVDDGRGARVTQELTVTIAPQNAAPVAANDSYSVNEDGVLTGNTVGNDSDPDVDPFTAALVTTASHGTVVMNSDGSFTYTPDVDYNGADSFTYQLFDGLDVSNTATVSVTVAAVNDVPVANGDDLSVEEDGFATIDPAALAANDVDVDGDTLTATVTSAPTHGTLTSNGDGTFTYTPNPNYNGTDSFTYSVTDGTTTSNTATVTITVNDVAEGPVTTIPGTGPRVVYTADRSRVVVTTQSDGRTSVSVFDTVTNTRIGQPVSFVGETQDLTLTENGQRAIITAKSLEDNAWHTRAIVVDVMTGQRIGETIELDGKRDYPTFADNRYNTRLSADGRIAAITSEREVAFINVETGTQIGSTAAIDGSAVDTVRLNADGSRAVVVSASDLNATTSDATIHVTVLSTADGTVVGGTSFAGHERYGSFGYFQSTTQMSSDSSVVTVTTMSYDSATDTYSTEFRVIDVASATQHGDTVVLTGEHLDPRQTVLNSDASRATITTTVPTTNGNVLHTVSVIDTDSMTVLGSVSVTGQYQNSSMPIFNADRTRAIIAAQNYPNTEIAVIDTTTGAQLGQTVIQPGYMPNPGGMQIDVDSPLAYVTTLEIVGSQVITHVSVIDTLSGARSELTYNTTVYESAPKLYLSPGNRALKFTSLPGGVTRVQVIDPVTGTPLGEGATGSLINEKIAYNADGTRVIIVGSPHGDDNVVVLDTATGKQIGQGYRLEGQFEGDIQISDDGRRAALTTSGYDNALQSVATTVTVLSLTSGQTVGETLTSKGFPHPPTTFSPDGTQISIVTYDGSFPGDTHVAKLEVPPNQAPVAVDDAVETAEDTTTTVDLTANDVDPDGDLLRAVIVSGPTNGSLLANGDGTFTYTPNPDFYGADSFTYAVTDGLATSSTATVAVNVSGTADVLDALALPGGNSHAQYTADGSKVVVTTFDGTNTVLSVVDIATNAQIGQSITITGSQRDLKITPDGQRAVIAASNFSGSPATNVVVVDLATGEELGSTVLTSVPSGGTVAGEEGIIRLSADGTRAAISTSTQVAVVSTATGEGSIISANGNVIVPARVSADGTRVTVTRITGFNSGNFSYTYEVSVYDAATGATVGTPITFNSNSTQEFPQFSADGKRATVGSSLYNSATDSSTSEVRVIDVENGTQLGGTLSLSGGLANSGTRISSDGDRLTVTRIVYDRSANTWTHLVGVYDTNTLNQMGTTTQITSNAQAAQPRYNADGTRVIIAVRNSSDSQFAVVDTTTGNQLGVISTLDGSLDSVQFDQDGSLAYVTAQQYQVSQAYNVAIVDTTTGATNVVAFPSGGNTSQSLRFGTGDHAVLVTSIYDEATGDGTTEVRMINQATGAPVGDVTTMDGSNVGYVRYSDDGSRVIVTTFSYVEDAQGNEDMVNRLVVVDSATGEQVGDTVIFTGEILSEDGMRMSADGRHATIFTSAESPDLAGRTNVIVLRIPDGNQIGETISIAGYPSGDVHLSDDAAHLTTVTYIDGINATTRVRLFEVPFENSPPSTAPSPGEPNRSTGVVSGSLNATDYDNDVLAYTVVSHGQNGLVSVTPAGEFTYTPSDIARLVAAASLGDDTDSFVVNVSDGNGGETTTTVTVEVAPAGVVNEITVGGYSYDTDLWFSPDSNRAIQIVSVDPDSSATAVERIVVIDTETGAQVGDTIALPGQHGTVVFSSNRSRAVVMHSKYDTATSTSTTYLTTINTADGSQIGDTVPLDGYAGQVVFAPDGRYAVARTMTPVGGPFGTVLTKLTIIDAETGELVDTTDGVEGGSQGNLVFSADGTTVYQTTNPPYLANVFAVDVATGQQVGDTLTLNGIPQGGGIRLIPGDRAIQTVNGSDPDTGAWTTSVVTINLADMTVVGDPVVINGSTGTGVVVSPDGTRAVQIAGEDGSNTVAVIDTSDGTLVGTTTSTGASNVAFSQDGSLIVVGSTSFGDGPFGGPGSAQTTVTLLEAQAATPIGTPYSVSGQLLRAPELVVDGTRVLVITSASGGGTTVSVLDSSTGLPVGIPVTTTGNQIDALVSSDRNRVYLTLSGDVGTTKILAVDLVDGSTIGIASVSGFAQDGLSVGADGTKALLAVVDYDSTTGSTLKSMRVVEVDIADAPFVDNVIALEGVPTNVGVQFTPDGTRAIQRTLVGGPTFQSYSTTITVIDPAALFESSAPSGGSSGSSSSSSGSSSGSSSSSGGADSGDAEDEAGPDDGSGSDGTGDDDTAAEPETDDSSSGGTGGAGGAGGFTGGGGTGGAD